MAPNTTVTVASIAALPLNCAEPINRFHLAHTVFNWPRRIIPQTLTGRIYALFASTLVGFLTIASAVFYHYEFTSGIDDALASAQILSEVVTPTIGDNAVIGDYDTVRRTLAKAIQHSPFATASFIDLKGGVVTAERPARSSIWTPGWLRESIAERLSDINSVINVGGQDYGVLRLRFAPDVIAAELWGITRVALGLVVVTLAAGLGLIRLSLRAWLEPLERVRHFTQAGGTEGDADLASRATALRAAPLEIRETLDAFARREAEFQVQRITAAATLVAVGDGVITIDPGGTILYANPAAERLLPLMTGTLTGCRVAEVLPEAFEAQPRDAMLQAWPLRRIELSNEESGRVFMDTALAPVLDGRGAPIGHVLTLRDVSAAQAYEDRLKAELDMRLSAVQSLRGALRGLLDPAEFGKYAAGDIDLKAVSTLIEGLVREREASRRAMDHQKFALDQHAAVTISDPAGNILYANHKLSELSGYAINDLVGGNQLILSAGMAVPAKQEGLQHSLAQGKVWHGEFVNRHKDGSLYWVAATAVPWLDEQGQLTQYITIRTDITPQRKAERALAEAHERELATGREIQRSLLIGELPTGLNGVELASYNQASRGIDGDFYVITTFNADCFELLVGDVMGKGVPAALIGAAVRTSYNRVLAELLATTVRNGALPQPAAVVNALHNELTPRLIELDTFVTLALYRFDRLAARLTYVNAGHTPALLRGADGGIQRLMGENLPVGVMPQEVYRELNWPLKTGDTLLVYSDGITEARNSQDQEFGEARLVRALVDVAAGDVPTHVALQALRCRLQHHVGDAGDKGDDETAVLVSLREVTAPLPGAIAAPERLELPWNLAQLAPLRMRTEAAATALGFGDDAVGRVVLAVFEAATNVVRHARPPIDDARLSVLLHSSERGLAVELWYVGEPFCPPDEPQPDFSGQSEGGFGLYIILHSVTRVSYTHPAPGINCTRLELDLADDQREEPSLDDWPL